MYVHFQQLSPHRKISTLSNEIKTLQNETESLRILLRDIELVLDEFSGRRAFTTWARCQQVFESLAAETLRNIEVLLDVCLLMSG